MTTGCVLSTQHSCQRTWLALWGKHHASKIPFTLEKPGARELCPGTAAGREGTLLPPLCPEAAAASSAGRWEPRTEAPLGDDAKRCKCCSLVLVLQGTSVLPSPAPRMLYATGPASNPCFFGVRGTLDLLMPKGCWFRSPRASLGWEDRQTLLLQPHRWDACHFLWREH